MKKFTRLGMLAAIACMLLLSAGCPGKQIGPVDGGGEGLTDSTLPTLTGEALRAADELTNAKIYFEYDKFEIKAESRRVLARKAELLKQFPQIKVSIQGHCDERGTEEYNLALGERRARAAHEFLVYSGVNPTQMEMISYGKLRPAVQGNSESAWAQNRRDEFIVLNPRGK
ncbi:Peptidoglycan-associated lipoprotein [uncultured delta proteobacterium]|uniref:Peptidoglycan-associated lipoprotein n=1 Tax=uncultured delta proteobacterium TaxID=34034 RepID=A0A212JPK3_9DELT|nr:Peptidoglycan-associated lipoprotein [uncultured delta proteobacterium]